MSSLEDSARQRHVTLQDVAEHCGVSRALVSRILRGQMRYASKATAARIIDAAKELGYDPSHHLWARRLALSGSDTKIVNHVVALYLPPLFFEGPYFTQIYKGISEVMRTNRFSILLDYAIPQENELPYIFVRGDVDAVMTIAHPDDLALFMNSLRREPNFGMRPFISMVEKVSGSSFIGSDDLQGGMLAARHLLELGHRHIVQFITGRYSYTHSLRREGHRQACVDFGVDPDKVLAQVIFDTDKMEETEASLADFIRRNPDVTGILAVNDYGAEAIFNLLKREGISVPDDISLVGYDDANSMFDEAGNKFLTSVRAPLFEIGKTAAEVCLKRINGELAEDIDVLLPVELAVFGSTSAAKVRA